MVLAWMNEILKGSAILEKFKSKRVRYDWLQRFMDDYGFTTEDVRPLEECRKKWETSENVLQHYQLAAKVLVEAGLAVKNPDYKVTKLKAKPRRCKALKRVSEDKYMEKRIQMMTDRGYVVEAD